MEFILSTSTSSSQQIREFVLKKLHFVQMQLEGRDVGGGREGREEASRGGRLGEGGRGGEGGEGGEGGSGGMTYTYSNIIQWHHII